MAKKTIQKEFQPRIVVFAGNWCSYPAADSGKINRRQYSPIVRVINILLYAVLLLFFLSCEKDTSPLKALKDPRDYTWTVDTLIYPGSAQTKMRAVWGTSPNNVYIVGHNDRSGPGTMYRYNGKNWSTTGFHFAEGGNIKGAVTLQEIFGFSPNNILAVGETIHTNFFPPPNIIDSSLIIHFDGVGWNEVPIDKKRRLNTVWGSAPDNIWAGGSMGSLYHYTENSWQRDSLEYPFPTYRFLSIESIAGNSADNVYMTVYIDLIENFGYYYLFQYEKTRV